MTDYVKALLRHYTSASPSNFFGLPTHKTLFVLRAMHPGPPRRVYGGIVNGNHERVVRDNAHELLRHCLLIFERLVSFSASASAWACPAGWPM